MVPVMVIAVMPPVSAQRRTVWCIAVAAIDVGKRWKMRDRCCMIEDDEGER
jgi:hypothetical protein